MNMNAMDMGAGMAMAGMAKCNDCGTPGDSKGMVVCTAPACAVQAAADAPLALVLDLDFVTVSHDALSRFLFGRETVPDPYPPRTSDIG